MSYTKRRLCIRRCLDELIERVNFIKPAYVMDTETFTNSKTILPAFVNVAVVEKKMSIDHPPEPAAKAKCRADHATAERALMGTCTVLPLVTRDTIRGTLASPLSRVSPTIAMPLRRRLKSETWDSASLFLMDIVGFTTICSTLSSTKTSDMLHRFFKRVDIGLSIFGMVLIDIIGDAYLAMNIIDVHYEKTLRFAIFCINAADKTLIDTDDPSLGTLQVRTAVHSGDLHSIVLDTSPFRYTLVGPSLAVVKFLETHGKAGAVHCSAAVIALINQEEEEDISLKSMANNFMKGVIKKESRMDIMQLSVSPYKTLVLDAFSVSPVYSASLEVNIHSQTYLVYERRITTLAGEVVVCPCSLRFLKISNRFCLVFGFDPAELRNFRMLCGPGTDFAKCAAAFREVFEFRKKAFISTPLYTKTGNTAGMMGISLSYHAGVDKMPSGVCMRCHRIAP